MVTNRTQPGRVDGVDEERRYTRREWLVRHAILSGASPALAREAVASTAIEHEEWDMDDERRTMAEWEMMENGNGP